MRNIGKLRLSSWLLIGVLMCVGAAPSGKTQGQQRLFIGKIESNDDLTSNEVRIVLEEELGKFRDVTLVSSRESADSELTTTYRIEGVPGYKLNATVSVRLYDLVQRKTIFAGSKSAWTRGSSQPAILRIVSEMKKALRWTKAPKHTTPR